MKIMHKMIVGFLAVAAIALIFGVFNMNLIKMIDNDINNVQSIKYPINQYATNYQRGANMLWLGTYIYSNGDVELGNQYIRYGKKMMDENRILLARYLDASQISEFKDKEDAAIEASGKVVKGIKEKSNSTSKNSADLMKFNLNFLQQRVSALTLELSTLVDDSQADMTESLKEAKDTGNMVISSTNTSLMISLILSVLFALFISSRITNPLRKLTDAANKISKGNLDVKLPDIKTKDEINDLNESMKGVLAAVQFLTETVNDQSKAEGKADGKRR